MRMHSVFIRHIERLRRLVVAMGLSAEEGKDILQDVFVEALKGPLKYRSDREASQWLMRVTANRCLLEFRRRKRHSRAVSEVVKQWAELKKHSSGPDMQAIRAEEVEAMMQCLREMDESLQVPLAMRYFCELNSTEIGEILELEPGTVRKRLYKGRIVLADTLLRKGIKL
ncbi:MAG TPA: sigma-70 family RNA polymerase sigma factor [Sedimentisphaerales bacterium]|nr:sigma-70 family RNA polymerase sigma factor [Sedimentisphaerales bacterium]